MTFRIFGGVILVAAVTASVSSYADEFTVDGHVLDVVRTDAGDDALLVDGQEMQVNGLIMLDEIPLIVGGVTVLTGVAGAGGNACGAAPMVVQFAQEAGAEVFGPIDSCNEFEVSVGVDQITYRSTASPAVPGETWIWRPMSGFERGPPVPFDVDPALSWDNLAALENRHPADALRLIGVMDGLKAGLGENWPLFTERMSGIGSGDIVEGGYLGRVCIKFTCDTDYAVIYLERTAQKAYIIWRVDGEDEVHKWPETVESWPSVMREILGNQF